MEIVFLAMLAGFIALRLVSVLGRRTGHENPAGDLLGSARRPTAPDATSPSVPFGEQRRPAAVELPAETDPGLRDPLQRIADADQRFDPAQFLDGAKSAYRMILEAFWRGDLSGLEELVSDDVALQFRRAIEARQTDGLVLENRLIRIDRAQIVSAQLHGMMAEVTIRFDADIVAVTRKAATGEIVGGSTSDALTTHDVWTFSRHVGAPDPNWLLIATDDEA